MVLFFNGILIVGSLVLFCYWFRYTCFLILAAEALRDYSQEVATTNQLAFLEVRSRLRKHDATGLDHLHNYLERDFATLIHLLEHTRSATFSPRFEEAMLTIHFRTLSTCFYLTRSKLQASATEALEGMSRVVIHLANKLGELQTGC